MIDKCYYNDNNFIHARLSSKKSLLTQDTTTGFAYNPVDTRGDNVHSVNRSSYPMMLELITESLVGSTQLSESCYNDNYGTNNIDITEDSPNYNVPTMNKVLQQVQKEADRREAGADRVPRLRRRLQVPGRRHHLPLPGRIAQW